MPDLLLSSTTSLCRECKRSVAAGLWQAGNAVVMRKVCAEHGAQEALISSNADWYRETMAQPPELFAPREPAHPVERGCPFDCGPCQGHEQRVLLPIVPITSSCNLDCPICYTHNKNEGAWHLSELDLRSVLNHLKKADPDQRIINLTGGEPTLHPQFERIVELCHEQGIRRITISTHGLRFLKDEWLLEKLARLEARIVLSFDSFKPEVNKQMLGGNFLASKLRVLDLLEKHNVNTTLLPVLARGLNDDELGAFVGLALSKDFIRSVELHTVTFTGQYGAGFQRSARYTAFDALTDLERTSGGALRVSDFAPLPSAHPLCYQVTYLLKLLDGRWLPFPSFMRRADLRAMLRDTLYLLPGAGMEQQLKEVIDALWAETFECADREIVLATLKDLTRRVFAPGLAEEERLQIAEHETKAVYLHAHMDEETFDTDRVRQCCVSIREASGANVPSCAYNVVYRERDNRFMESPAAPLVSLGRGAIRLS